MKKQVQQVTVKGILENRQGKMLFVKDRRGKWELPGGRMAFGENPRDALQRELKEELGISHVQPRDIIHCWAFESSTDTVDYHFIVLVFTCNGDFGNITISNEHSEFAWLDLDNINQYPMRGGYLESVEVFKNMMQP